MAAYGRFLMISLVVLILLQVPVLGSEEGGAKEKTKYFDISIEPDKSIFSPDDVMRLKITVADKKTHNPVENATVVVNISIYQGHFTETKEIRTETDDGIYVVEQITIKSNLNPVIAGEEGKGVYAVEKKIDTKADLGGVTLKVHVEKEGKSDKVSHAISFMKINPWIYAVGSTLLAVICGLGIGLIFGGTKH